MAQAVAKVVINLQYPLFILSNDDLYIQIIKSSKDFRMEKVDIEDGLYSGWDINGYPIKLSWENGIGVKVDQIFNTPELDEMEKAVFNYVNSYSEYFRPDKAFVYDRLTNDYVGLIKKMKEHIRKAPFKQKVINFIRRF